MNIPLQIQRTLRKLGRQSEAYRRQLVPNSETFLFLVVLCVSLIHVAKAAYRGAPHDVATQLACLAFFLLLRRVQAPPLMWARYAWLTIAYWFVGLQVSLDDALHPNLWGKEIPPAMTGALVGAALAYLEILADHSLNHNTQIVHKESICIGADDEVAVGIDITSEAKHLIEVTLTPIPPLLKDITITVRKVQGGGLERYMTLVRRGHVAAVLESFPPGRYFVCISNDGKYAPIRGRVVVSTERNEGKRVYER